MALPPWVPIVVLLCFLAFWGGVVRNLNHLASLPEDEDPGDPASGRVCLCIPARNEALEIGAALDSWLAQDFPEFRIVVVDDGSTDVTPLLLGERLKIHSDRLSVLRNDRLPPGWLGKNHALNLASSHPWAEQADWVIFVDADVRAETGLLKRVMAYLRRNPVDVLALFPGLDAGTLAERCFVAPGAALVLLAVSPRAVANPRSRTACGIGAFTLIRRSAYDTVGGHAAAPLEAIDDMALAYRAKRAGASNRVMQGGPALRLRMYHGWSEILQGIRKNILALPWYPLLLPLYLGLAPLLTLSPLWLSWGGWPGAGLLVWLVFPVAVGTVHQRMSARPAELAWAFWPLLGPLLALGALWALWDRLRGRNVWRGRSVPLGRP